MDPALPPYLALCPSGDAVFLKGMLGGGAHDTQWTAMRARMLGVPLVSVEAAARTARPALADAYHAGLLP